MTASSSAEGVVLRIYVSAPAEHIRSIVSGSLYMDKATTLAFGRCLRSWRVAPIPIDQGHGDIQDDHAQLELHGQMYHLPAVGRLIDHPRCRVKTQESMKVRPRGAVAADNSNDRFGVGWSVRRLHMSRWPSRRIEVLKDSMGRCQPQVPKRVQGFSVQIESIGLPCSSKTRVSAPTCAGFMPAGIDHLSIKGAWHLPEGMA